MLTKQVCEKIPVKTPKYIDVPVCVPVPHYTCHPVARDVPDTECIDEPYQKCHKVPNQVKIHTTLQELLPGGFELIETSLKCYLIYIYGVFLMLTVNWKTVFVFNIKFHLFPL